MDVAANKKMKVGATPGKVALIGILAVVLVAVVMMQFPEDVAVEVNEQPRSTATEQPAKSPAIATAPAAPAATVHRKWQEVLPAQVAEHDPFARPAPIAARFAQLAVQQRIANKPPAGGTRKSAEMDERLKGLQSQGVRLVLESEKSALATIGTQVLRIGDVVEGYRVTEIGPRGVVLDRVDAAESPEEMQP